MLSAATGMGKHGWTVSVAGRAGSALLPRTAAAGIRTHVWPFHWELDLITYAKARGLSGEDRPDLVVVGSGRDIRAVGLASRQMGIPVVWSVGGRPKFAWFQRLTRDRLVDHVLVPSEYLRGLFVSAGWSEQNVMVIPIGIEPADTPPPELIRTTRHTLGIIDDAFMILFVGSLRRVKQVDVLIRAFQIVNQTYPQSHLVIVGSGVKDLELEKLTDSLGLKTQITFSGFSSRPDEFFNACDLFVLPSREETFGVVLLEAMTRAKPIVASRSGAIPEVTGGGEVALLVESGDVNGLSEAMQLLISDPALRARLGQNGAQRVRQMFTETMMHARLNEFFGGFLK